MAPFSGGWIAIRLRSGPPRCDGAPPGAGPGAVAPGCAASPRHGSLACSTRTRDRSWFSRSPPVFTGQARFGTSDVFGRCWTGAKPRTLELRKDGMEGSCPITAAAGGDRNHSGTGSNRSASESGQILTLRCQFLKQSEDQPESSPICSGATWTMAESHDILPGLSP
jgi:hypothetical protein